MTPLLALAMAGLSAGALAADYFPESRFGRGPAPVIEPGVTPRYAARAVSDIDEVEDVPAHSSEYSRPTGARRPAGLEFAGENGKYGAATAEADVQTRRPNLPGAPDVLERGAMPRKGVQEVALIAGDLGYFPRTVFVTRDIPVRMFVTGASRNTLCIMMDSFAVKKQVRSQKIEEVTFTPGTPGKYRFYCPVNGMEGTLVVKELSSGFGVTEDLPAATPRPENELNARAPAALSVRADVPMAHPETTFPNSYPNTFPAIE